MISALDRGEARMSDEQDLAHAAKTIVAAHRIRELTKTISGANVANDANLAEQCAIVGSYGRWLSLGVIRRSEVYDAQLLSNTKAAIGIALVECARRLPLSKEEITSLGDMYFYLSCFHEEWGSSKKGDEQALFAKSVAEGRARRAEWIAEISPESSSRFSRLISSWLKPNA